MIRIEAENALKMTEQEMLDVAFEASENSVIELNVVDPDSQAGDNDGVYLEIINYEDRRRKPTIFSRGMNPYGPR